MTNEELLTVIGILIFIVFLPAILFGAAASGWYPFKKYLEKKCKEEYDNYCAKNKGLIQALNACGSSLIKGTKNALCDKRYGLSWETWPRDLIRFRFFDEEDFIFCLNSPLEIRVFLTVADDPYFMDKRPPHKQLLFTIILNKSHSFGTYAELMDMAKEQLENFQDDQSPNGLNYLIKQVTTSGDFGYDLWESIYKAPYITE